MINSKNRLTLGHKQWQIQEFPGRGGGLPTPKVTVLTYYFSKQLHKNENIWTTRGMHAPGTPVGSANLITIQSKNTTDTGADAATKNECHCFMQCFMLNILVSLFAFLCAILSMIFTKKKDILYGYWYWQWKNGAQGGRLYKFVMCVKYGCFLVELQISFCFNGTRMFFCTVEGGWTRGNHPMFRPELHISYLTKIAL